jgi:threonine synthase
VRYDLERLGQAVKKEDLKSRRADLWRYWEFLPLEREENIVSLGEGFTPIFTANNLGRELGFKHLYIKDEGLNPTGRRRGGYHRHLESPARTPGYWLD